MVVAASILSLPWTESDHTWTEARVELINKSKRDDKLGIKFIIFLCEALVYVCGIECFLMAEHK